MNELDSLVLEHLRAIRRQIEEIRERLDGLASKSGSMADATQMDAIARKFDGLTFVVGCSFESLVRRLTSLDQRLARLPHKQV